MTSSPELVSVCPLLPGDPPRLGRVIITGRIEDTDAGVIFVGELVATPGEPVSAAPDATASVDLESVSEPTESAASEPSAPSVLVVVLSEGAQEDSYGRARFLQAVERLRADDATDVLDADDDPEVAPWVALGQPTAGRAQIDVGAGAATAETTQVARQVLAAVTLSDLPPTGRPAGPDYRPHWFRRRGTGRWRLWPLPWPSALTSAGRWTFVAAFALILVIASIALWLAIQIFNDQPPSPLPQPRPGPISEPPPPPTPTPTPTPTDPPPTGGPGPTGPGGTPIPPIV